MSRRALEQPGPGCGADVAAVLRLVHQATPRCGDCRVVAVDGPSGSGKTTLARAVADRLAAPVLHLDLFYPGWDGLALGVRRVTELVLQPFSRGAAAVYRPWDWHRDTWGATRTLLWVPVLVVEGCGSSAHPAAPYAAVRVWMEAEAAVRRARGLARDGQTYAPHWEQWARQERALFDADRPRDRADLVLDTTADLPRGEPR